MEKISGAFCFPLVSLGTWLLVSSVTLLPMTHFPLKVIQSENSMNEDGINPLTGLYSLEFKKKKKVNHHYYCFYYYEVPVDQGWMRKVPNSQILHRIYEMHEIVEKPISSKAPKIQ